MVSLTPTKFNGHKHNRGGDLIVLLCHLITQDHMSKASSNIMGRSPSRLFTILTNLLVIGTVVVEIKWFKFVTWSCKFK